MAPLGLAVGQRFHGMDQLVDPFHDGLLPSIALMHFGYTNRGHPPVLGHGVLTGLFFCNSLIIRNKFFTQPHI